MRPSTSWSTRSARSDTAASWLTTITVMPCRSRSAASRSSARSPRPGVERPRRLVGEKHLRLVGQSARQRHRLALATRELSRDVLGALAQPHLLEQLTAPLTALAPAEAAGEQRRLDVPARAQIRKQQVLLEDEADDVAAELDRLRRLGHGRARHRDRPGVGVVEASDQVEQRALARAGRSGDRDELRRRHRERDAAQGLDAPIGLDHVADHHGRAAAGRAARASTPCHPPPGVQRAHRLTDTGQSSLTVPWLVCTTAWSANGSPTDSAG